MMPKNKNKAYQLDALMQESPSIIIVTTASKLHTANRATLKFFDYPSLEALLKEHSSISEFFEKYTDTALLHEMHNMLWLDYVLLHPYENYVYMQKQGVMNIFKVYAAKLESDEGNLYACVFTNITELENQKERYKQAIEGSNVGLWDWDLQTNTVYFAPRWKEMLGYKDDELPSTLETWREHIHPDDLAHAEEQIQANIEGKTEFYRCLHRLRHKNGHWVWIDDRGKTYFSKDGTPLRMVGSHDDVTREQEMIEEIRKKDEIMIAQSKHAAMGEMISMIAHQWRQPISFIAMCANNMLLDIELDTINKEEWQTQINDIIDKTTHLSSTIDDFRNFFKPDKHKEYTSIKNILDNALSIMQKSFENHGITVAFKAQADVNITVYARELMQVLLNILKNAKEAIESTRETSRLIQILLSENDTHVIMRICDNGGGIQEAYLEKIFEPYFSTKDEKNGTGLGLYMSKAIVEKHLEGKLHAYNYEDGACFEISLPKG